jgi:hypothetical protein
MRAASPSSPLPAAALLLLLAVGRSFPAEQSTKVRALCVVRQAAARLPRTLHNLSAQPFPAPARPQLVNDIAKTRADIAAAEQRQQELAQQVQQAKQGKEDTVSEGAAADSVCGALGWRSHVRGLLTA